MKINNFGNNNYSNLLLFVKSTVLDLFECYLSEGKRFYFFLKLHVNRQNEAGPGNWCCRKKPFRDMHFQINVKCLQNRYLFDTPNLHVHNGAHFSIKINLSFWRNILTACRPPLLECLHLQQPDLWLHTSGILTLIHNLSRINNSSRVWNSQHFTSVTNRARPTLCLFLFFSWISDNSIETL